MPLNNIQKLYNESILMGILNQEFKAVVNKQAFLEKILPLLDQHNIDLNYYTGLTRSKIVAALTQCVKNNVFQPDVAARLIKQVADEIARINAEELAAFKSQAPEINIISKLKTNGHIDYKKHLFTKPDIDTYLESQLKGLPHVQFYGSISIANPGHAADFDAGTYGVIEDAFRLNKDTKKTLIIPANLNNSHWVLLVKRPDSDVIESWNSLREPTEAKQKAEIEAINVAIERAASAGLEKNIKLKSHYTGAQTDGNSCGAHVCQMAVQVAGVRNELAAVPRNNPSQMFSHIVKTLAAQDPELKKSQLGVVNDQHAPLVYVEERSEAELKPMIAGKKRSQKRSDEFLAIVLQDVYIQTPEITDHDAMTKATQVLETTSSYQELTQTKTKVVAWMKQNSSKLPSFFATGCRQEAQEDGQEDKVLPTVCV